MDNLYFSRFSGIWISDSSTPLRKLISLFCRLLSFFVLTSYILTSIADLVVNCNDLIVIVDDSCFIAGAGSAFFKICTVIFKYQKFEKLITGIHDPVDVLRQSNGKIYQGRCIIFGHCSIFRTSIFFWN